MLDVLYILLRYIGAALVVLGCFSSIVGALGLHRFRNFYLRLHAATVSTIWGSVYPIIGLSLISMTLETLGMYRWFIAGAGLVTAFIVLILAPAGSHALARGVHRSRTARVEPCVKDVLDETLCG